MTYIKNDIIFTELKIPHTTNHKLTELQNTTSQPQTSQYFQYIHTSKRHYKP